MARKEPDPIRITTATRSHSDDIAARQRRYLISMGVRTVCFIGAVVAFLTLGNGWLMWVLVIASFVLPYVAVVMANTGAGPDVGGPDFFDGEAANRALEGRPEDR
jgi:hypothetical protein